MHLFCKFSMGSSFSYLCHFWFKEFGCTNNLDINIFMRKFCRWRNKISLCLFCLQKTFILYWVELLLVSVRINGYEPELHWTCNQIVCGLVVTIVNKRIVTKIKTLLRTLYLCTSYFVTNLHGRYCDGSTLNKNRSKLKLLSSFSIVVKLVHDDK